ncbi:MAG: hypothetical protein WKF57_19050 [Nakamurella sp.]
MSAAWASIAARQQVEYVGDRSIRICHVDDARGPSRCSPHARQTEVFADNPASLGAIRRIGFRHNGFEGADATAG